jgi:hypothetical protein
MRRLGGAAAALVVLAACGGGDGRAPETKAAWRDEHGAVVEDLGAALDRTQAATKDGEPTAIRANCEGLRDSVEEARGTPPVPDQAAEAALQKAVDALGTGAADCVRAMTSGDTRLLERSITELREARLQLDTANAALRA